MDWSSLSFLLGNAIGLGLKRWPAFSNRYIPAALFAVNILVNIVKGARTAGLEQDIALAGFGGAVLLAALWDTLKAVGLYSALKNTFQK